jgi:tetratricopeptide (TPR) repeat protein
MENHKRICFVVMGFGKKTDPSTGRTLDLDKTYKNIIKPAVITAGLECVRGDEVQDSGLIDRSMYALLIQADIVIADISTYNPNALYELGIRHAVKPFSTIIIKEKEGKIPFDLDHTRIFQYTHLGEDIGADETIRCRAELAELLRNLMEHQLVDSPLYEHIQSVRPPILPKEEYAKIVSDLADQEKHIFAIVEAALAAMQNSNFKEAFKHWCNASRKVPNEAYFIQQMALCRYKSKEPSENTALVDALNIISRINTEGESNDPETLGITGSIYKRLWEAERDMEYLSRAIENYKKGFVIRNDYYNGENYALCLDLKAFNECDYQEKIFLKLSARKARQSIITKLEDEVMSEQFKQRGDAKWVYATLSQCHLALGNLEASEKFERLFLNCDVQHWESATFYESRKKIKEVTVDR